MFLISSLSEKFIACSYSLKNLGINNVAWNYKDTLNVIEYLVQYGYIILGGDVYRLHGHSLESTYDSWFIDKSDLPSGKPILIAQEKTIEYISMYHRRNGDQYVYSLVFEKCDH